MRLKSLELRNYRNYARLELEPGVGLNLFLGANGQGKTNLLESVALLALTRRVLLRLVRMPRGLPDTPGRELIGRVGVVTREIGPHRAGQVRIGTDPWTARAYTGDDPIPAGTAVEVMLLEGATALVHPLPERPDAPLVDG